MPRNEATGATRVGLGGAGLGNHRRAMSDETAHELLEAAWEAGVRHFDTAPHYGLGLSERRLGEFLAGKPRQEFTVSTKVGRVLEPVGDAAGGWDDEGFVVRATHRRRWDFSGDGIRRCLEDSMTRLRLDHVDTVYLHDPERWRLEEALQSGVPALARLRDEGLTLRIGVGSMAVEALAAASLVAVLDDLMVAGRLTILDSSAAETVLPGCVANGIEVTAAATLNGGLLAAPDAEQAGFDYADPPSEILQRARQIATVSAEFGVHPAAVALQFAPRFAPVRRVVVGADDPGQLAKSLEWSAHAIPEALWDALGVTGSKVSP